jgi:sulfur carrier protein
LKLYVNGEETELDVTTLSDLVDAYKLTKGLVVLEVDGEIIDRDAWSDTEVKDGMKIEIVHFVGGG